uniref:(3R)-3-hydroxyacyl-CoA dehydrogenase n=1 Tax=Callorhinchus milii TaxID=7868 RepID=V9LAD4_CALMI
MAAALRLRWRLAIVTGGGSGIGRAVCQRFAEEGASVAVVDVEGVGARETLGGLARGPEEQLHTAFTTDISNSHSVSRLFTSIQECYSRPACVAVNCAGVTRDQLFLKMSEEAFDEVIQVNLKGTFLVSQAMAEALIRSGAKKGSIINIGSIVGKMGNVGQTNYSASKAGVVGLTKSIARELGRVGVRCNAVLPGFIESPMTDKIPRKLLEKYKELVPLGRFGDPVDVANVCVFLASDESRYITGTSVEVTGGLFL